MKILVNIFTNKKEFFCILFIIRVFTVKKQWVVSVVASYKYKDT